MDENMRGDWHKIKMDEIFPEDEIIETNHQAVPVAPPRNKLNFKKKNLAPLPPGNQRKFGNYKPKICDNNSKIDSGTSNPNVNNESSFPVKGEDGDTTRQNAGYVMIGDKHKPLIIGSPNGQEMSEHVSNKSLRKNDVFNEIPSGVAKGFDAHEGIFNYGEVVSNPLFGELPGPVAPPRRKRDSDTVVPIPRRHKLGRTVPGNSPERESLRSSQKDGADYPYIPEPDYDLNDSEATITLHDNQNGSYKSKYLKKNRNVYKEYDGDDFGQYMSDDEDYEFDTASNISCTSRKDIRYEKMSPPKKVQSPKRPLHGSKPSNEAKVIKSSGKALKPADKSKPKTSGRNTIREFSFAHSKLGGGDRTVKSTSALGRQAKSKERPHLDITHANDTGVSQSYEDFLRVRHGDNGSLKSSSSDSGLEMMDDAMRFKMFQRNQPRELRKHGESDSRQSVWQKLTWRFRKNVAVYDMGDS